tara:strand:+ start:918 stop:1220 length:303 start_codon:yes stop_codon:yes gene_type:complete
MASPSSSPRSPKPTKPQKKNAFVGRNEEFLRNEALPIQRNYSNNSNNNSPVSAHNATASTYVPHRTEGTTKLHGRIRNKKKTRGKRRKSGKKTKRKKRSN